MEEKLEMGRKCKKDKQIKQINCQFSSTYDVNNINDPTYTHTHTDTLNHKVN